MAETYNDIQDQLGDQVDRQDELAQTDPVAAAAAAAKLKAEDDTRYVDTAIHIDLDDEQEKDIVQKVDENLAIIQDERNEAKYEENAKTREEMYDGVKEQMISPWDNAANYFWFFLASIIDIVTIKAKRATLAAHPLIRMQIQEGKYDEDAINDREQWMDDCLRHSINIERLLSSVYWEAPLHGISTVKVPYVDDWEWTMFRRYYHPEPRYIDMFTRHFADKLIDPKSPERQLLSELEHGRTIKVDIEEHKCVDQGPRPYRVPMQDFYARLNIADLRKQVLVLEKRPDIGWAEIEQRAERGFYRKPAMDKLTKLRGDDKDKATYDVYEFILNTRLDNGKLMRYMGCIETNTRTILRFIHYPYWHNKPNYINYYIKSRDNKLVGVNMGDRLLDPNRALNGLWNMQHNNAQLAHTPIIVTDDRKMDVTMRSWGPLSTIYHEKGTELHRMELEQPKMDAVALMEQGRRMGELNVGVSGTYMSGRESPVDPRAPAAKTAMLINESNMIVQDTILELQAGNAQLAEQVESLSVQHGDSEDIEYSAGEQMRKFKAELLNQKVRYIPHATLTSEDTETDMRKLTSWMLLIKQFYPEIAGDSDVRLLIAKMYLQNAGGTLERNKDRLLLPMEKAKIAAELQKQITELRNKITKKGYASMLAKMDATVNDMMASAGEEGNEPPPAAAAAGAPGAPAAAAGMPEGGAVAGDEQAAAAALQGAVQ